jgi:hypothetical protein
MNMNNDERVVNTKLNASLPTYEQIANRAATLQESGSGASYIWTKARNQLIDEAKAVVEKDNV